MGNILFKGMLAEKGPVESELHAEEIPERAELSPETDASPKIMFEDVSKRDAHTKHFVMSDGTCQAQIFTDSVHYYNEQAGKFVNIDNSLCDCPICQDESDDFDGWQNRQNRTKVKFSKNLKGGKLFVMKKDDFRLVCKLRGRKERGDAFESDNLAVVPSESLASAANGARVCCGPGEIRYNDFVPGADLQYLLTGNRLKENIVVKQRLDDYQFEFTLKAKGLNLELSEDRQNILFYINRLDEEAIVKEVVFSIPAPVMFDASGAQSGDVTYELEPEQDGKYLFRIVASADWVNDSARAFPVTVDPMINFDDVFSYVTATSVFTAEPNSHYSPYKIYAGRSNSQMLGDIEGRTFGKVQLPGALLDTKILNVQLSFYCLNNVIENLQNDFFTLNRCNQFSSTPAYDTQIYETLSAAKSTIEYNQYVSFDITKLFLEDQQGYKYFVIKRYDESRSDINLLILDYVERKPLLTVSYLAESSMSMSKSISQNVLQAGVGSVDLFSRRLSFRHSDVQLSGLELPMNIYHVYTNRLRALDYVYSNGHMLYPNLNVGKGWKLNIQQSITDVSGSGHYGQSDLYHDDVKYIYLDGEGIEHPFVKKSYSSEEIYADELGTGYELTRSETSVDYVVKDLSGNKIIFYGPTENLAGYLREIQSVNGSSMTVAYDGLKRILWVMDGNGVVANFSYQTCCCGAQEDVLI